MRHRKHKRKLGRTGTHRDAMLRNMANSLFKHERIRTTVPKAKLLRSFAEKLITKAKCETLHARRQILVHIHDNDVVSKLFDVLSVRYSDRPGGYTRIIRIGHRQGDAADMCFIELVDREEIQKEAPKEEKKGLLDRLRKK